MEIKMGNINNIVDSLDGINDIAGVLEFLALSIKDESGSSGPNSLLQEACDKLKASVTGISSAMNPENNLSNAS